MSMTLPPGQRLHPDHPRFGLPWYAHRTPERLPTLSLELLGPDGARAVVSKSDLDALRSHEQVSDFHCVTTWSRKDLRWSGVPFRVFYDEVIRPRVDPEGSARYLVFRGVDGYDDETVLDDLLGEDVMFATALDGKPLNISHGGPLRLVAPKHYGYKSVKHLARIELRTTTRRRLPWSSHHPRGRVAFEERFLGMPGRLIGEFYRTLVLPVTLWWFRRYPRD